MKRWVGIAIAICITLSLIAIPFSGCAGPAPTTPIVKAEYKWRLGQDYTSPLRDETLALFCDLIEVYSDGRIEVEYYPNASLGSHNEVFHAVQEGSVEAGEFCCYTDLVPGSAAQEIAWSAPGWVENAIATDAPDGIMFKVMSDALEEVGLHQVFQTSTGPMGLVNNVRPLKTPDDLRNLKMRVSGAGGGIMFVKNCGEGTGMTLETIPWIDLFDALGKGVIDGCWNSWSAFIGSRHHEVVKYYSDLKWEFDHRSVVLNKELWDGLPSDLQDAIYRAGKIAAQRDISVHQVYEVGFKRQALEAGVEIYYPTADEISLWIERSNVPAIWDELAKPWLDERYPGQNMAQKIQDELARIHAEVR